MKQLAFKKKWIEPVLAGEKTSTIRARTSFQVGELVAARCSRQGPPFAQLEIVGVKPLKRASLDPEVAAAEGVLRIYPEAEDLVEIGFKRVGG